MLDHMTAEERKICKEWRHCLDKNGGHRQELIDLLDAAGVDDQAADTGPREGETVMVMCRLDHSTPPMGVDSPHGRKHIVGHKTCGPGKKPRSLGIFNQAKIPGHNEHQCAKACLQAFGCEFGMFRADTGACEFFSKHKDCEQLIETSYPSEVWAKTSRSFCESLHSVNSVPKDFRSECIDPITADPESWDCDCYDEMVRRCSEIISKHDLTGFSMATCLRAEMCNNPLVCEDWKASVCKTDRFICYFQFFGRSFREDYFGFLMCFPHSFD